MIRRMNHLILAGNIRVFDIRPEEASWSSYQYSVACAMLGLDSTPGRPTEQSERVVETEHGIWEHELGVVMEAALEVLEEWSDKEEDEDDAEA